METILRIFQVLLAIGLIGVVLLQRSEGGGLGVGSSGGMGSFMSVRGTANFLTRVTSILGGLFMLTCMALALIGHTAEAPRSIFDVPASTMPAPSAPKTAAPGDNASGPSAAPVTEPAPAAIAPSGPAATIPAPLAVPSVVATPTTEIPPAPIETPAPAAPVPNATGAKSQSGQARKSSHKEAPRPSGQ